MLSPFILLVTAAVRLVAAENIYIQVAAVNYTSSDNTTTFSPQRVTAQVGDIVFFNFTSGNHSATQSTFASPCRPAHDTNISLNGFDSDFHVVDNTSAGPIPDSILSVPILDSNIAQPMWFYDKTPGACGSGAVGVINSNESSFETVDGFVRNAERLNGSTGSLTSASRTATSTASSGSGDSSSGARSVFTLPLSVFTFAFMSMNFAMLRF